MILTRKRTRNRKRKNLLWMRRMIPSERLSRCRINERYFMSCQLLPLDSCPSVDNFWLTVCFAIFDHSPQVIFRTM